MIGRFTRWQLQPEPTPIVHVIRDEVHKSGVEALVSPAPSETTSSTIDRVDVLAEQLEGGAAEGDRIPVLSLVAHNVRKPGQLAPIINGFSWDFLASRTYFIIGRNGVGKSLLLKSLTAVRPASVRSAATPVYYAARDTVCDEAITPETLMRALCGAVTTAESLNKWGISDCARRYVRHLSQGERTRLMLAAASVLDPPLLLLDEPTLGLDQNGLSTLHRYLAERRKRRRLTIVASHELTVFEIEGGELLLLDHDFERTRITQATDRILQASARFNEAEIAGGAPEVARALIESQMSAITRAEQ